VIITERQSWLHQILRIRRALPIFVRRRVLATTAVGLVVTLLHELLDLFASNLTPLPFTLVGVALSIFLGFRNNTGYDRFWEGRKLWGMVVNVARSLTRQLLTLIGPRMIDAKSDHHTAPSEADELARVRHELVYVLIAYVHALRHHLRDEDALSELEGLLPPELQRSLIGERNRPIAILQWMGERLRGLYDRGWIHPLHLTVLEGSLTQLTDIQGACERIKSTPIPASYTVLMHRIVALYCLGLPFGIVESVGELTPVVVAIVAYAFYGLDAVGTEVENPFGFDPNDLPLSSLTRMIEINLRQRLGEQQLPPALEPVDGILQ
jgi:putative membrane protein